MGGKWHSLPLKSVYSSLYTSESGLSEEKAEERLQKHGPNEIEDVEKDPWYMKLLVQVKSLPILLLLAASAISLALGLTVDHEKLIDAVAIFGAVVIAVSFSFWQEYKAESALEALKKMVVQRVIVVRGGRDISIDSKGLVPGDVVILEEGSRVPADMRIIEATNLAVDQSTLTGESRPSEKEVCNLHEKAAIDEQRNMLFAGTTIVRGHGKGVVVSTAMDTEFGKIVGAVAEPEERETPLQRNIEQLSRSLGYAGIAFATVFFIIGMMRGESATNMFVVAVTLAVAVIPEGLPTVLAITLALGVQKMAKQNAIVRKMNAVETLGSATVICTDKTGTITLNRMVAEEIVFIDNTYGISEGTLDPNATKRDVVLGKAVEIMALCNNAMRVLSDGQEKVVGDPTESALLQAVASCGADEVAIREAHALVGEIPFDSDRKMMSAIRMFGKSRFAMVKGAPEKLIHRCARALTQQGEEKLTEEMKKKLLSVSHSLGSQGRRLIALAYRPIGAQAKYTSADTEKGLVYVGMVAMEDPPRQEVAEAISLCHSAGIRVVMVTGDSLATAKAIAERVGLLREGRQAMDGSQLSQMADSELDRALETTDVFARASPDQKLRIVSAFKRKGEVVAVTGDGVNDSPAIKKADIGVAMGVAGTDVTKEVSDIVLTDDNFASIVSAIKAGRTIFNNIKSFVRYQISTNVAALSLMFAAPVFSLPLPLLPVQILWINIMIDGPPALALGAEPPSHDEMKRPPRNAKAGFVSKNLIVSILLLGLVMAFVSLAVFGFYQSFAPERASTAVFTLFVFLQLLNALNCRSASESLLARGFSNPYLYLAIAASLAVHLAIVYLEPLEVVFKTVPLRFEDLALVTGAALIIIVVEETKKMLLPYTTSY